jgi:hypothetical protein
MMFLYRSRGDRDAGEAPRFASVVWSSPAYYSTSLGTEDVERAQAFDCFWKETMYIVKPGDCFDRRVRFFNACGVVDHTWLHRLRGAPPAPDLSSGSAGHDRQLADQRV